MVFNYEIETKGIRLSPQDKQKYDEACGIFDGRFPYQQGLRYQKLGNEFRLIIKDFFIDKNLRHYRKEELVEILYFEDNLMATSN